VLTGVDAAARLAASLDPAAPTAPTPYPVPDGGDEQ
jgi:hypothetical protein